MKKDLTLEYDLKFEEWLKHQSALSRVTDQLLSTNSRLEKQNNDEIYSRMNPFHLCGSLGLRFMEKRSVISPIEHSSIEKRKDVMFTIISSLIRQIKTTMIEIKLASYGKQAQLLCDQGEEKGSASFIALSAAVDVIANNHKELYPEWIIPKVVYDLRELAQPKPETPPIVKASVVLAALIGVFGTGMVLGLVGLGYHFTMWLAHIGR